MKKICFLLGGFQGNGGIGRVTSILANELSQNKNFEVHTISYFQDKRPMLYNINFMIKQHALFSTCLSMTRAIVCEHAIKNVREILNREKIDILIACGALFYPIGILSCKKTDTKCICWEHTNPEIKTDYKFQNLCRKFAVKQCNHIVVLTKSAKKYYKQHYHVCEEKISQIYNPIDENASKSIKYDKNSKKIITVGRLCYQKNIERLISIASNILPKYPDWSWDVFGDGDLKEVLQKQINDSGLTANLTLKGQVSDLYDRYREYAFMVMTSRYEGFPMTLIEGAANRLPLVSFDIPTGPDEIIMDGMNGYLIDKNSDGDMINKIIKLMDDTELRENMSDKVYELTKVFSTEKVLEEWETLFAALI